MKRKGLLLVLLGIVSLFATAKRKVVVFPDFGLAPTAAHTIDSIALSDKETVLYCTLRMYGKVLGNGVHNPCHCTSGRRARFMNLWNMTVLCPASIIIMMMLPTACTTL